MAAPGSWGDQMSLLLHTGQCVPNILGNPARQRREPWPHHSAVSELLPVPVLPSKAARRYCTQHLLCQGSQGHGCLGKGTAMVGRPRLRSGAFRGPDEDERRGCELGEDAPTCRGRAGGAWLSGAQAEAEAGPCQHCPPVLGSTQPGHCPGAQCRVLQESKQTCLLFRARNRQHGTLEG